MGSNNGDHVTDALNAMVDEETTARGKVVRKGVSRRDAIGGLVALLLTGGGGVAAARGRGRQSPSSRPDGPGYNAVLVDAALPSAQPTSEPPTGESPDYPDLSVEVATLTDQLDEARAQKGVLEEETQAQGALIQLYEQLEELGLDRVLVAGWSFTLEQRERLGEIVLTFHEGLSTAKGLIEQLDQGLAPLDLGLGAAEKAVDSLYLLFAAVEEVLRQAGEKSRPVTDLVGGWVDSVLGAVPGGQNIKTTMERIGDLVSAVPETVLSVNTNVIRPLRDGLFPRDESGTIRVRLLEPIVQAIYEPAAQILDAIYDMTQGVDERELEITTKLEEAQQLRNQIAVRKQGSSGS